MHFVYYKYTLVVLSMSEIEHITDTEFAELLEHVYLGELDIVDSCIHTVDEQQDIVSAPVDDA